MRTSYNTHAVVTASYYCKLHNISQQPSVFYALVDLFETVGVGKSRRYRKALKNSLEPSRYATMNSVCRCVVRGGTLLGVTARQENLLRAMRIKS